MGLRIVERVERAVVRGAELRGGCDLPEPTDSDCFTALDPAAHRSLPHRTTLHTVYTTPSQSHLDRHPQPTSARPTRPHQHRQRVAPHRRPTPPHRPRTTPRPNPRDHAHRRPRRARHPRHHRRDHPHPHHRSDMPLSRHRSTDRGPQRTTKNQEREPLTRVRALPMSRDITSWSWGESNPRPSGGDRPCYDHSRVRGSRCPTAGSADLRVEVHGSSFRTVSSLSGRQPAFRLSSSASVAGLRWIGPVRPCGSR